MFLFRPLSNVPGAFFQVPFPQVFLCGISVVLLLVSCSYSLSFSVSRLMLWHVPGPAADLLSATASVLT